MVHDSASINSFSKPVINMQGNSGKSTSTSDEKYSSEEYFSRRGEEDDEQNGDFKTSEFVDRSAQLKATLNSLAMMNVANLLKKKPEVKEDDYSI